LRTADHTFPCEADQSPPYIIVEVNNVVINNVVKWLYCILDFACWCFVEEVETSYSLNLSFVYCAAGRGRASAAVCRKYSTSRYLKEKQSLCSFINSLSYAIRRTIMHTTEGHFEPFHEILKMTNVQAALATLCAEYRQRYKYLLLFSTFISSSSLLVRKEATHNSSEF